MIPGDTQILVLRKQRQFSPYVSYGIMVRKNLEIRE